MRRFLSIAAVAASMIAGFGLGAPAMAQDQRGHSGLDPLSQIPAHPIPPTVQDGFTFAAVGDMIYSRPLMPTADAGLDKVTKLLHGADVAFANQEGSILDLSEFKGYPQAENGGAYPLGPPAQAMDIKAMGIGVVSKANNHATDFGIEGLSETRRLLETAGVLTAGSGRNRAVARGATLIDTPKGRVAVVAAASTFTPMSVAGLTQDGMRERPGISVLRTRKVALVTPEEMVALKAMGARYGATGSLKELTLLGQAYRVSDKPGLIYEMNDLDRLEILKAIRDGKQMSDMAVFSIHAHENAGSGDDTLPADFERVLFHNAIDAGADVVVEHGPHLLRGIEIYKGKPIFYGIGTFIFQLDMAPSGHEDFEDAGVDPARTTHAELVESRERRFPRAWFESVVAITEFEGGQVKEVRLYPLDLNFDLPFKHRGAPKPASPEKGRAILEGLRKLSAPFGTDIRIENAVGVIHIAKYTQ